MAKVKEAMSRDFAFISPAARIVDVAQKMTDHATSLIPVCEDGKLRGVVKARDIIAFIAFNGDSLRKERAQAVMDREYPMVSPGEDLLQAARIMANNSVRILPVTQNGKLLGLLTIDDIAHVSLTSAATVLVRTAKERLKKLE